MAKVVITIHVEQTKPTVTAADLEAIINWVKTNVMDKLPQDASATFTLTYTH